MHIEGSCHCRRVRFSCEAYAPVPYQRCYCSICRKTAGGGGYAINLGAWKKTLAVIGREHIGVYRARIEEDGQRYTSSGRRHFCKRCGSALWLYDPEWPELVHPHASAIDHAEVAACTATDQRGLPRPVDGDGNGDATCDIGAVEIQRDLIFGDGFDG